MRRLRTAAAFAPGLLLLASAALAAGGGGHAPMKLEDILWEMGIKVLDVSIIAFFGFKLLSKPIAQAMADRSAAVRAALEEANAAAAQRSRAGATAAAIRSRRIRPPSRAPSR